jgi:hypothetical protein
MEEQERTPKKIKGEKLNYLPEFLHFRKARRLQSIKT